MANANDGINTIATGFKNIFLAGVGAMALTGERTKELVDQLVAKGEITVEQGKQVTADLQQKATAAAKDTREDVLKAIMNTMTPEERAEFAKKAAAYAAEVSGAAATADAADGDAKDAPEPAAEGTAEVVDVEDVVEEDKPETK